MESIDVTLAAMVTDFKAVFVKANFPILVSLDPKSNDVRLTQSLNAKSAMYSTFDPLEKLTVVNWEQDEKAFGPIILTDGGIIIVVIADFENAFVEITSTPSGIVKPLNKSQSLNAPSLISLTLEIPLTYWRDSQSKKTYSSKIVKPAPKVMFVKRSHEAKASALTVSTFGNSRSVNPLQLKKENLPIDLIVSGIEALTIASQL